MTSRRVGMLVELFERVGHLYQGHFLTPTWDRFGATPNTRQAFELFLGSYAYEYQGASPAYAPAAAAVIRSARSLNPVAVWSRYKAVVGGKTNARHNPLAHTAGDCTCILCLSSDAKGEPVNFITVLRERLQKNDAELAYQNMIAIRGIGPKIASFILRDVSLRYGIQPKDDRALLQPVDIWIRRFVWDLARSELRPDLTVAQWVVDHSAEPELANAGMWYFGARIVPQRMNYERALAEPPFAHEQVENYVNRLVGAVAAWRNA